MTQPVSKPYRDYITARYQGEVFGEALFGTLAARAGTNEARNKWRALQRLETTTKLRLRQELEALGEPTLESEERRIEGTELGASLAAQTWAAAIEYLHPRIVGWVEDFRAAEALAPADRRRLVQEITEHEIALRDFTALERLSQGGHSVASAEAMTRRLGI
jgi:hypothetical protein